MNTINIKIPPYPIYKISAFREFIENEWHITRLNSEYILIIMFEGTLYFTENGIETALCAGDWYIQKPGMFQSAKRASISPKYYYIHFDIPDNETSQYYFPPISITIPTGGKCNPNIYHDLFSRMSSIHPDTANGVLNLQSTFIEFFMFFLENETEEHGNKTALEMSEYIREHYKEDINLKTLAKLVNYSEDYVRTLFKKSFNQSPSQFLTKIRMEDAKKLLSVTDYPIEKIAFCVGYTDASVFYRNFCKTYGMNPSVWRKTSRNLFKT